jgi:hypothetical protein
MTKLFGLMPMRQSQRDRLTPEYRQWRTEVFVRDDYTCQTCGQRGGTLNAHHRQSYVGHPHLRTELNNGITLCKKCHDAIHRIGGNPIQNIKASCKPTEAKTPTQDGVAFNNRLLNDIHAISGNALIVLGLLIASPRGLTMSQALEKLTPRKGERPCMIERTFSKNAKALQARGYVEVFGRGRKSGRENLYRAKFQGTYGLGYTLVPLHAIHGVIYGAILPAELKLYIQLLRYASGGCEAWPSQHVMARDLRIDRRGISKRFHRLEGAGYLYVEYYYTNSGARHCKYKLRV